MKRLTQRDEKGKAEIKYQGTHLLFYLGKCGIDQAIEKLAAYEDTGFTPEEVQQLVDQQKWHVVAEGDLPDEKGFYQCTVLDNQKNEVFIADVYKEAAGFFYDNELYEVIAWRELPEPWKGENNE